jgi:two-component system NtrC family sensor kinase
MWNLERFGFTQMMECRAGVRALFENEPATTAEAAQRLDDYLYRELVDDAGQPACALVRTFKTHDFGDLPPDLRTFARRIAPEVDAQPRTRCLVLIGTTGDLADWRSRELSRGHRCIPLVSEKMVASAPMIARLIQQLGVSITDVIRPDPGLLLDRTETASNVFYVPQALGSPYIVAQKEFVERYRIRSVIGFGGMISSTDLLATILFTKVPIPPDVADLFKVIGLNVRLALMPFARKQLF